MKLTALQAADDRSPPHPQRQQLRSDHHCVLTLCQFGNPPVKMMSAGFGT
jgi:hypothetical protein